MYEYNNLSLDTLTSFLDNQTMQDNMQCCHSHSRMQNYYNVHFLPLWTYIDMCIPVNVRILPLIFISALIKISLPDKLYIVRKIVLHMSNTKTNHNI